MVSKPLRFYSGRSAAGQADSGAGSDASAANRVFWAPLLPLGALLFFLSGFAALQYQVVWQRLLAIFSGADLHSITIIVAAFMGGLGLGSLAGGRAADRLTLRAAWLAFAGAEFAVGLFGLLSTTLYYDVLYLRLGHLAASTWLMPLVLFLSLLWPTFFMGAALPLLARALTTSIGVAPRVIGLLYGFNTFGAAVGAFATTWWLIPWIGLSGSLSVSAALNLVVAAGAASVAWKTAASQTVSSRTVASQAINSPTASQTVGDPELPFGVRGWSAIYALSGLVALSFELVWFRLLGVLIKATAFTFGTLLGIFLTGLATGAVVGSFVAPRVRRPATVFLLLQTATGTYASALIVALLAGIADLSCLDWLRQYLNGYEPLDLTRDLAEQRGEFFALYFLIPGVLILPATVMMGASFPLLQRIVQTDLQRLGSRTGTLLVANILGSTVGTLLTGWWALGALGIGGTLRLLVALTASFTLTLLVFHRERRSSPGIVAAGALGLLVALLALLPGSDAIWARLHDAPPNWIVAGEDATGVSVLVPPERRSEKTSVFVNGIGQSWIPYGGIHTILGALPAFVHPAPKSAALIGLGSGDTVFAVAGRAEIERIVCIEIVGAQRQTLLELSARDPYPGLRTVLFDPRITHVVGDGRLYARTAGTRYDIIEADALRPGSAYSGNLYSDQYFRLLLDHLAPGGLAVTWSPTPRIERTFLSVFPHVVSYGHLLLGSNQAIRVDADAIRQRLQSPAVRDYYLGSGVDIEPLLEPYLSGPSTVYGPDRAPSSDVDINTDLFPRDEFTLAPLRR